jgi:hypothetical protein
VTYGYSVLVAELPAPPVHLRRAVLQVPPRLAVTPAAVTVADGGRALPQATAASDEGLGFDSPFGRFAIVAGGVLLGGSAASAAGVSLVLPSGLVGLAALVGGIAVLAQRRVEQRRRVLR